MVSDEAVVLLAADASSTLGIMAKAASLAATGLMTTARKTNRLTINEKTAGDFVSDADRNAEATIFKHLDTEFPGYGWLGEESGDKPSTAGGHRWIVDPLDGTTNFLKGIPHWAISIALYKADEPVAALIFDPAKSETFSAERGKGAYLNGQRIKVADGAGLTTALLATGVPNGGRSTYLAHCLRDLDALMPQSAGVRRFGAAALDLAYVAAGRFDTYWERNLGPWDIAAGALIVQEAGGCVRPLWPDQDLLASGSFIAGPARLVDAVLAYLDRDMVSD